MEGEALKHYAVLHLLAKWVKDSPRQPKMYGSCVGSFASTLACFVELCL